MNAKQWYQREYMGAAIVLAFLPYSYLPRLKSTSKSWNLFLSSKSLFSLRRSRRRSRGGGPHLLCVFPQDPSVASPYLFDPQHLAWRPLPPLPRNPYVYGLCNFTVVAVGYQIYLIGGSLFDAHSFPLDLPSSSSSAYRFDFLSSTWVRLALMLTPRWSFACAAAPDSGRLLVAGGGSRHTMFGAAGSRVSSAEMYDIGKDEWVSIDGLPRFRAGCVGFLVEDEFWVMGGYGESRTVSGVFPVDQYYRDAVVMGLRNGGGGRWREVGDMWEEGERMRLGKLVVVEGEDEGRPGIFMLDGVYIFRYDMASNRWQKESNVPRKAPQDSSFGFVELNGELHVMTTFINRFDSAETRRTGHRAGTLFVQIYDPRKKTWRSLVTKPPFYCPLDFSTAIMCTFQI